MIKKLFFFIFYFSTFFLIAQKNDTLKIKHSPTKAAILSAIIPGSGQLYNKKYWKIPVVYSGLTFLGYITYNYHKKYILFKDSYKELYTANQGGVVIIEDNQYTLDGLILMQNYYHRRRDLFGLLTFGWYFLNIIDATVDAYLFDYDISEKLTLKCYPYLNTCNLCFIFKINLKF